MSNCPFNKTSSWSISSVPKTINQFALVLHCKKWIFQKNVNMTSKDDETTYLLFQENFQQSYQFWMVVDKYVFPDYS